MINTPGSHMHIYEQNFEIHEAKPDRTKGGTTKAPIIDGDFNTPLSLMIEPGDKNQ